jgi:hypothetical protein
MNLINPTTLWSMAFWKAELTAIITVFATAFAGTLAAYTAAPTVHDVEIAAWSAAAAALAYFVHSLGSTSQATKAAAEAKHLAP